MKPAYIILLVFALLVAAPSSYGEVNDGKDSRIVTLTVLPIKDDALRKEFWETLVKIAQPVTLEVPANRTIMEAVGARCGSAPEDLQLILRKLNPDPELNQGVSDKARQLTFIPCPYWEVPESTRTTTRIQKGQSISEVLPLYMGTAGKKTQERVKERNPTILDDKGRAKADGVIRMPYKTTSVTFRLRDEITENSEQIIRQLHERFGEVLMTRAMLERNKSTAGLSYGLDVQEGPEGCQLTALGCEMIAKDELQRLGSASKCKRPDDEDKWPFNIEQIAYRYEETRIKLGHPVKPQTIVVADTGLDLSDPAYNRNLWTDYAGQDFGSDWGSNTHGTNLTAPLTAGINPSPGYPLAAHGTEVVRIMLGGGSAPVKLLDPFNIAVAKIIPDSKPFVIPLSAVSNAFRYANEIKAHVLNLSAVVGREEPGLVDGLKAANFLAVVAAGNDKKVVEQVPVFPAAAKDELRARLIVVGAHDWENRLTDFSNFGEKVDLLAPGCAVPVRGQDGKTTLLWGTSFAAPFVSFTAALLGSLGMPPDVIKSRILATVYFDEQLADYTSSAGRLNIENALRFKDDILVTRVKDDSGKDTEKELYGELKPGQSWSCIGVSGKSKANYAPQMVARVVPRFPAGGNATKAKVWAWPAQKLGASSMNECTSLSGRVAFREKSSSPWDYYEWSQVVSVIPKIPPIPQRR
jgi:subtilisin family serine protease